MERATFLGLLYSLLCAVIWGGQAVVARLSAFQGLTNADVTVLRFAVAGCVLFPLALRNRPFPVGQLGVPRALVLFALAGAPYVMVLVGGAAFAGAADSAAITFGVIPIASAAFAHLLLGERLKAGRAAVLALIGCGITFFAYRSLLEAISDGRQTLRGHLLFIVAGIMWAGFTVLSRRWRVNPMAATATISVISLASLPIWMLLFPSRIAEGSAYAVLMQAIYMGLLVGVLSLVLYQKAIASLGATVAATLTALAPVVASVGGAAVFGEMPTTLELVGILFIISGLALVPHTSTSAVAKSAA
jgi:drug/metabolite transporter (DMT)-like permease